jgi:predicted ferric reductase
MCRTEQTSPDLARYRSARKEIIVLTTLLIVLVILWLLGVGTSYTLGGLIHVLLVIAVIIVLLRVIQGRNPIRG